MHAFSQASDRRRTGNYKLAWRIGVLLVAIMAATFAYPTYNARPDYDNAMVEIFIVGLIPFSVIDLVDRRYRSAIDNRIPDFLREIGESQRTGTSFSTSLVNAASLLAGGQTSALMAQVRERFDLVLIDSPPLAGLADGLILASQSDVVVLVARAGVTKPADLTAIMHTLHTNMTSVAGAVVFEDLPAEQYESGPDRAKTASPVATS